MKQNADQSRATLPDGRAIRCVNAYEVDFGWHEIVSDDLTRHGLDLPPDGVYVDVGANIGLFCLRLRDLCPAARLFAFEPMPAAFEAPAGAPLPAAALDQWWTQRAGASALPWSATGNITTGRMAVEYLLRGATSFQLHTFFQLPAEHYAMKVGNRTQRALHELHFHPATGLVVWLHHFANLYGKAGLIRLLDIARSGFVVGHEMPR